MKTKASRKAQRKSTKKHSLNNSMPAFIALLVFATICLITGVEFIQVLIIFILGLAFLSGFWVPQEVKRLKSSSLIYLIGLVVSLLVNK